MECPLRSDQSLTCENSSQRRRVHGYRGCAERPSERRTEPFGPYGSVTKGWTIYLAEHGRSRVSLITQGAPRMGFLSQDMRDPRTKGVVAGANVSRSELL